MLMRCCLCEKEYIKKSNNQKFCSISCRQKNKYLKQKEKYKQKSLIYYYKNKEKILKYQKARIERLRKENPEFRKKYNARHRASQSIPLKGKKMSSL